MLLKTQPPLPGFEWLPSTHIYSHLHETLWPQHPEQQPSMHESLFEPPTLLSRLLECSPMWDEELSDMVVDEQDEDGEPVKAAPDETPVRYIPLNAANKAFAEMPRFTNDCMRWGDQATFVVRKDYKKLLNHALERLRAGERPRIFIYDMESSLCSYYILFVLLAAGHSVFLLDGPGHVYFFSQHGVQCGPEHFDALHDATNAALKQSWALVDMDVPCDFSAKRYLQKTQCVVATDPGRQLRQASTFRWALEGETWDLANWTSRELLVLGQPYGVDRAELVRRVTAEQGQKTPQRLFDSKRKE
uniref:Uncharacterized protein n=1 Tax=Mycena chlorophos TaxID=658473 RepID=A0ABQ0M3V8_MYCCL|nr:predicted protein [Mycena chlorophos]